MEDEKNILGGRIRRFRKRLKLKQADLASEMGFNSSETISQIERGEREIKAWEISEISKILFVSVDDLLKEEKPKRDPVVLWRQSPIDQKEAKEALFIKRCHEYVLLEDLSEMRGSWNLPQKELTQDNLNFETADLLAVQMRRELSLGDRPAEELEKTLQNVYGVKIWYLEMEEGSAASTIGVFGPAILMNYNEAPWRRNFNFAHELFHLITWNAFPPSMIIRTPGLWEKLEKVANAFASSLLLPNESVTIEFNKHLKENKTSYTDLIGIARSFGVSTEALLYRLLNMSRINRATLKKVLDDPLFRGIDRSTMAPCWWQPPRFPERFVRLAFGAFQKGKLSRAKLCELLDTSLIDLPVTLQEYGLSNLEGYDAEVRAT